MQYNSATRNTSKRMPVHKTNETQVGRRPTKMPPSREDWEPRSEEEQRQPASLPFNLALSQARHSTTSSKHSRGTKKSCANSALFHVHENEGGEYGDDHSHFDYSAPNDDIESVWASLYTNDEGSVYTTLTEATFEKLIDAIPETASVEKKPEPLRPGKDAFHHGLDKDELISMVSALTMESTLARYTTRRNKPSRRASQGSVQSSLRSAMPTLAECSKPESTLPDSSLEDTFKDEATAGPSSSRMSTEESTLQSLQLRRSIRQQHALLVRQQGSGREFGDKIPQQPGKRATIATSSASEDDDDESSCSSNARGDEDMSASTPYHHAVKLEDLYKADMIEDDLVSGVTPCEKGDDDLFETQSAERYDAETLPEDCDENAPPNSCFLCDVFTKSVKLVVSKKSRKLLSSSWQRSTTTALTDDSFSSTPGTPTTVDVPTLVPSSYESGRYFEV